jgi:hypothetical protein
MGKFIRQCAEITVQQRLSPPQILYFLDLKVCLDAAAQQRAENIRLEIPASSSAVALLHPLAGRTSQMTR